MNSPMRQPFAGFILLLLVGLGACTAPVTYEEIEARPEVIDSTVRWRKEYVVVAGDVIDLFVRLHPELNRSYGVRPDGMISLPYLDDFPVAGKTFPEIDAGITAALASKIKDPEVTVIASEIRPASVFIAGEVGSVGPKPLREAPTAAQAIVLSGGLKDSANDEEISVIRLGADGFLRAIIIPFRGEGQPAALLSLQNFPLEAGDIVFVPKSGIGQFNFYMKQFVNEPLSGVNAILGTYVNYKLIQELSDDS